MVQSLNEQIPLLIYNYNINNYWIVYDLCLEQGWAFVDEEYITITRTLVYFGHNITPFGNGKYCSISDDIGGSEGFSNNHRMAGDGSSSGLIPFSLGMQF
jgi:hypothetical protein